MSGRSLLRAGDRVRLETSDETYEGIYNGKDDDWICVIVDGAFKTLIPGLDVRRVTVFGDGPEPKKKEAG